MKTKIILTGAQGTGKTSVLNYFQNTYLNRITEVARNLAKQGVKINEGGDGDGQIKIFETYEKLLNQDIDYISDRGLTDVLAYSFYLYKRGRVSSEVLNNQKMRVKEFFEHNPNILVFYFPIEFDVVSDGVRSTDPDFRNEIDEYIENFLGEFIPNKYYTVHGTVEERIRFIIDKVDDLLIDDLDSIDDDHEKNDSKTCDLTKDFHITM